MGLVPYLIYFLENDMKKIYVFLTALILCTSLFSCRNYKASDGNYDEYNDGRNRVGDMIKDGTDRAERGIRRGFDRAERGFDNVTGLK